MKPTTNQLAQIIIQTSEEINKTAKDIQSQSATIEKASNQIEQASTKVKSELNQSIERLKHTPISLDHTKLEYLTNEIKKNVEKGIEDLKKEKKQIPYIIYAVIVFILSAICLLLAFKYGYTTKRELRTEIEKENIILDKTEYNKLRKFSESFPKDYKKFEKWYEENYK